MTEKTHETCYNYLSAKERRNRFPKGYCVNHRCMIEYDEACPEWASNIQTFIFTFGSGHAHPGRYIRIKARDWMAARTRMVEMYGSEWAFQYTEQEWEVVRTKCISRGGMLETQFGNTIDISGAGSADDGAEATK